MNALTPLSTSSSFSWTWVWTRAGIISATERRAHEGALSRQRRYEAIERLHALAASRDEVTGILAVRTRADALPARHPLRAADAGRRGAADPGRGRGRACVRLPRPSAFIGGGTGKSPGGPGTMKPGRARMGNAAARQRRAAPAPSSSPTRPIRRSSAPRARLAPEARPEAPRIAPYTISRARKSSISTAE